MLLQSKYFYYSNLAQLKGKGSIYTVQLYNCTIAMSNVHLTSLSHNLSLKVVFLFQSFLAITVFLRFLKNAPMKTEKSTKITLQALMNLNCLPDGRYLTYVGKHLTEATSLYLNICSFFF